MGNPEAVFLQVLKSRVQAVAHEMAENILRAAHSAFIKETWDLAALLTTPSGEAFACPKDIAEKRLGMDLGPTLADIPEVRPGDLFVSNHPQLTAGLATHLPDLFFWKPIFGGDKVVCFALAFIHVSDIGGIVPGSINPSSVELYQEGLAIPPVRLFAGGCLQTEVRDMIMANSRVPQQLWGDITAVVGALNIAERRIHELLTHYPPSQFSAGIERLLDIAEERARALIRDIPDGHYTFVDYIDGLPDLEPIRICLTLQVEDSSITMDFTGSDPEVRAAYNLYSHSRDGHWGLSRAFADYFQTLDPDVPWNSGLVRPIKVRAPRGSVLNPATSAACGSRVATFFRIYYMVFGALAQAVPGRVPASGPAEAGIMLIATSDPQTGARKINVGQTLFGGGGARPLDDGFDGNEMVSGYLRNVPIEVLEGEMPVRFLEYLICPGTGGPGKFRGGHGVQVAIAFLVAYTTVTIRGLQRHQFRAWGLNGGRAGQLGRITINPSTERERSLPVVTVLDLEPGDVLRVQTAGGGGYGNPFDREPERVAVEVSEGLLDWESAFRDYAVVLRDSQVDMGATAVARREGSGATWQGVDYGPERQAFEKVWTPEIYAELERAVRGRPPAEAHFLRQRMIATIKARSKQEQERG